MNRISNKVICINARPESLIVEGQEYEIEKFDQHNRCYLLKDVPHHREPERFRREDGIDLEVFQDFNEMHERIRDYNDAAREVDNQEEEIKGKIRKIKEKYGGTHEEYWKAICKEACHDVSVYR